jgi:hypothetical protein
MNSRSMNSAQKPCLNRAFPPFRQQFLAHHCHNS